MIYDHKQLVKMEKIWNPPTLPQKVKHRVTSDSSIPLPATCPREIKSCLYKLLYTNVHGGIIHNNPLVDSTHVTNR